MELTHVRDKLEQIFEKRTLFAVSPFFAILSAPTTFGDAGQILKFSDERTMLNGRTNSVYIMMLEQ